MTLIEDDTVLVSWQAPEDRRVVVTHYTVLYASQKGWLAGRWKILQRDGELLLDLALSLSCLDQTHTVGFDQNTTH